MDIGGKIKTEGLICYLDAGNSKSYSTGSTWYDLSKNYNNGNLINGPTFSSVNKGTLLFDGVNDYIDLGNKFNFTTENFTITFWIYLNSYTTQSTGQGPVIFYKGSYQISGYYCQIQPSGSCFLATNQSGVIQTTITDVGVIEINKWYNISVVRNVSSVRIFINGIDKSSVIGTHINPTTSNSNFTINRYGAQSIYGNLKIPMFFIHNSALSTTEIINIYNSTKGRYGY